MTCRPPPIKAHSTGSADALNDSTISTFLVEYRVSNLVYCLKLRDNRLWLSLIGKASPSLNNGNHKDSSGLEIKDWFGNGPTPIFLSHLSYRARFNWENSSFCLNKTDTNKFQNEKSQLITLIYQLSQNLWLTANRRLLFQRRLMSIRQSVCVTNSMFIVQCLSDSIK